MSVMSILASQWGTLAAADFTIQLVGFGISAVLQTEKLYDLLGSCSFCVLTLMAAYPLTHLSYSQRIQAAMVGIWAGRLGSFLFARILYTGEDKRFKTIKTSALRFFAAWMMQGVWVIVTLIPTVAFLLEDHGDPINDLGLSWANAITYLGWGLWVAGFAIECIADFQKTAFRRNPDNKDHFIHSGVWSISRHPNYFGEILLWHGLYLAVVGKSHMSPWPLAAMWLSPLFVTGLITQVSGIPLLERAADKKWGHRVDYQQYKKRTACLVPFIW